MKPDALNELAPPPPAYGENILAGIGPDLELPVPSSFAPDVLLTGRDRSQHFHNLLSAKLDSLDARLQELKKAAGMAGNA